MDGDRNIIGAELSVGSSVNPKVSIIIPHYGDRAHDLLKPCLKSIHEYTNLDDCEIIVVANGATEDAKFIVQDWLPLVLRQIMWFDEAIGYARACNEGIRIAKGDYIVLLNNDIELLAQPKNLWIDILLRAFWDERVAISGPMMSWCPWAEYNFLIGFCIMIRKTFLDQCGMYDESFEAYGEDTDLCVRAQQNGWKIKQVPDDEIKRVDGQPSVGTGNFPIWHKGNESYRNWPGGEELLRKNRHILHDRYATNIQRAIECDGWMSPEELRWLAQRARTASTVIELGSWHGKSTRAIADNLPPNGKLYAIDTWAGSKAELDTNHVSARWMDGDHAFDEFSRNLWDHIQSGKVVPLRMHGRHAAKLLKDKGVQADPIFIDAGHEREEVVEDINNFLPLRKPGGTICGHDYMMGLAPHVTDAVLSVFGKNVGHAPNTTIWYTDSNPNPKVYDCFIFNNESEILHQRLMQLYNVVDRFVIVEATKTHSGKPKELVFEKCGELIPYRNKITYIVVDDLPELEGTITDKSWARERHQRDAIMRGLTECRDNDVIIISDVDELPSVSAIQSYNGTNELRCFDMDLYYYNRETKAEKTWREAKILSYGLLKQHSPCWARYQTAEPILNGGEHLSYFGGVDSIIGKLENTAHQEYNSDEFKDPERIRKAIAEKRDLFDREHVKFA